MVLHWKHYFPNCPFSLERLQWAQGNVSNTLSLAVPQAMMGMLVWRLVENMIPTVEKFPEHNTLSLGCWVSVWGGVNLPQSPQIQTGSPADHRWNTYPAGGWNYYPNAFPGWVGEDNDHGQEISPTLTNSIMQVLSPSKEKQGREKGEGTAKVKLCHKTFFYNKPINIWLCYSTWTVLKAAKRCLKWQ